MDGFNLTQTALLTLFRETFEGVPPGNNGTWFVEGVEGIFNAIEQASADVASTSLGPRVSTLAAHTDHTRYYLALANQSLRHRPEDQPVVGDWPSSWRNQSVNEVTWNDIRLQLRIEFEQFVAFVEALEAMPNQEQITYLLANLAHAAFHLGAIRQILELSRQNVRENAPIEPH